MFNPFTRLAAATSGGVGYGITAFGAILLVLLAGEASAQTPPNGLPNRGVLRLQLGKDILSGGLHSPKRFVHEPSGLSQGISKVGNCGLSLGGPSSLAVLTATGGYAEPGLSTTSIGVNDGANSTSCYRITATDGESLTFALGPDIASPLIDANAFYRLELDIEVKKNAEFLLQILTNGTVAQEFRMRTGLSIVPGQGSTSPGSPDRIFNCTSKSDAGPDLGAFDNCRWIVDSVGHSFRLVPLIGEGSLEGGADFGNAAYSKNTLIYLTKGTVGAVGCESSTVPQDTNTATIGDGVNTAQCGVTRIDPTGIGGTCTKPVGYVFRSLDGNQEGCEINKTPDEALAASADIVFPPETATPIGSEPPTRIEFSTNVPGQLVAFTPGRCFGTLVQDHNGHTTIAEVLSVPGFVPDVVPGTPSKDWACILNNSQDYIGAGKMQVRQTILFWGDISFSRQ